MVMVAKARRGEAARAREGADPRDTSWLIKGTQPPLPAWVEEVRDYQLDAVEQVVERFEGGAKVVFLDAPTGCLAGDTELVLNRAGRGFRLSIQDLYEKINGRLDNGKGWDLSIPTKVAQGDLTTMTVRSSEIHDVVCSGLKDTLVLRTWDEKALRLTPDHQVMTPDGWVEARTLKPGSQVAVNAGRLTSRTTKRKPYYPRMGGMKGHPRASMAGHSKAGWVVPTHILVMEAHLNNIDFNEYVARLRDGDSSLNFITTDMHVHHKDGDTTNYQLDNLELLTASEHHTHHADATKVLEQLRFRAVERITPGGPCLTFDIQMVEGEHFMAEGIYVHNSGKSLIGELVRRRLGVEQGLYVCSTKSLQAQYTRDFQYAKVLKGRMNYVPTKMADERGLGSGRRQNQFQMVTCADCDAGPGEMPREDQSCSYCEFVEECPYLVARDGALTAPVGVLNTSYFLAECNGPGKFKGRDLVVADEADLLEGELLGFVELRVSKKVIARLGVEVPKKGSHMTTIRSWLAEELVERLKEERRGLRGQGGLEGRREFNRVDRLVGDVERVLKREDGWVRDNDEEGRDNGLVLKPVSVGDVAERYLWRHGERWLCMTGTLVSAEMEAESLGLEGDEESGRERIEWAEVKAPMLFAKEHRRVVFAPVGNMTRKGQEQGGVDKVLRGIARVLEKHPGVNVLIHTHTYKLAGEVSRFIKGLDDPRPVITYDDSRGRDEALSVFRRAAEMGGGVLVASSMDRGVDLPGDLCRVQIIAKVPMASLGSRQVSERLRSKGGELWYLVSTVRSILQMCGRAVRGKDDWAVTYVLDEHFGRVLKDGKRMGLFPQWWLDALEVGRVRDYV